MINPYPVTAEQIVGIGVPIENLDNLIISKVVTDSRMNSYTFKPLFGIENTYIDIRDTTDGILKHRDYMVWYRGNQKDLDQHYIDELDSDICIYNMALEIHKL